MRHVVAATTVTDTTITVDTALKQQKQRQRHGCVKQRVVCDIKGHDVIETEPRHDSAQGMSDVKCRIIAPVWGKS